MSRYMHRFPCIKCKIREVVVADMNKTDGYCDECDPMRDMVPRAYEPLANASEQINAMIRAGDAAEYARLRGGDVLSRKVGTLRFAIKREDTGQLFEGFAASHRFNNPRLRWCDLSMLEPIAPALYPAHDPQAMSDVQLSTPAVCTWVTVVL